MSLSSLQISQSQTLTPTHLHTDIVCVYVCVKSVKINKVVKVVEWLVCLSLDIGCQISIFNAKIYATKCHYFKS